MPYILDECKHCMMASGVSLPDVFSISENREIFTEHEVNMLNLQSRKICIHILSLAMCVQEV